MPWEVPLFPRFFTQPKWQNFGKVTITVLQRKNSGWWTQKCKDAPCIVDRQREFNTVMGKNMPYNQWEPLVLEHPECILSQQEKTVFQISPIHLDVWNWRWRSPTWCQLIRVVLHPFQMWNCPSTYLKPFFFFFGESS